MKRGQRAKRRRLRFHVVPARGGWRLRGPGPWAGIYRTKAEAVALALRTALCDPSRLCIHGRNGRVQEWRFRRGEAVSLALRAALCEPSDRP